LETQADIARSGLVAPIVGHVGDGNFHAIPVFDASDPAERQNVLAFVDRLAARAIAMDGTSTGEHGIGQGKVKFMTAEHGAGLAVMRRIKQALDPDDILNPGKILPLQD
jgi:D-lactate dehydrogenase (cytochrome)